MPFDLKRLLTGVFEVQSVEEVVVACDMPHGALTDTAAWKERREMAAEWRQAFETLGREKGFTTLPLLEYPATGATGAELPAAGMLGGDPDCQITTSTSGFPSPNRALRFLPAHEPRRRIWSGSSGRRRRNLSTSCRAG